MTTQKGKQAVPAPSRPTMEVSEFRGAPMLVMLESQGRRAATSLCAQAFPVGARLALRRFTSMSTASSVDDWADVVLIDRADLNAGLPFHVFKATSPTLARPERELMRLSSRDDEGYAFARVIDVATGLQDGDRVTFDFSSVERERLSDKQRDWKPSDWFERITRPSPNAAFEARNAEIADELIRRMLTEEARPLGRTRATILSRAREAYARESPRLSWRNRLALAHELIDLARRKPKHRRFREP